MLAESLVRVEVELARLAEIAPALRAHRALARPSRWPMPRARRQARAAAQARRHPPHPCDAVEALLACRAPLAAMTRELADRRAPPPRVVGRRIARTRDGVVQVRRAMGRASAARQAAAASRSPFRRPPGDRCPPLR